MILCALTKAEAKDIFIQSKNISLVLNVENGKEPQYIYFGKKVNNDEPLQYPTDGRMDIYPAYGMNAPTEAALAITHSDGNLTTVLKTTGYNIKEEGNSTLIIIHLKDPIYLLKIFLIKFY